MDIEISSERVGIGFEFTVYKELKNGIFTGRVIKLPRIFGSMWQHHTLEYHTKCVDSLATNGFPLVPTTVLKDVRIFKKGKLFKKCKFVIKSLFVPDYRVLTYMDLNDEYYFNRVKGIFQKAVNIFNSDNLGLDFFGGETFLSLLSNVVNDKHNLKLCNLVILNQDLYEGDKLLYNKGEVVMLDSGLFNLNIGGIKNKLHYSFANINLLALEQVLKSLNTVEHDDYNRSPFFNYLSGKFFPFYCNKFKRHHGNVKEIENKQNIKADDGKKHGVY